MLFKMPVPTMNGDEKLWTNGIQHHQEFFLKTMARDMNLMNRFVHHFGALPIEIILFYSNSFIEESVFFEELDDFERASNRFKAICVLTGGDVSSEWKGEVGRFDRVLFEKYVQDEPQMVYMMCGPEAFMEQVSAVLIEKGIEVKTRLKKECFG